MAMILLADVYLAVEDYTRANQLYLMSYREFEDVETAERLWQDVIDIATDVERREYLNIILEDMPDFFRRFWRKRDLDPTTPDTNEKMVEHYRRPSVMPGSTTTVRPHRASTTTGAGSTSSTGSPTGGRDMARGTPKPDPAIPGPTGPV